MRRRTCFGLAVLAAGLLAAASPAAGATDSTWNFNGNGLWTDSLKWTPHQVPNSSGATARLDAPLTSSATITLNTSVTLGSLFLTSPAGLSYTVAPGAGGALTFNTPSGSARIAGYGVHTIEAPLTFNVPLVIEDTDEGGLDLWLDGDVSGLSGKNLTIQGTATAVAFTAVTNPVLGKITVGPGENYLVLSYLGTATLASGLEVRLGATLGLDNSQYGLSGRTGEAVALYGGRLAMVGYVLDSTTETVARFDFQGGSSLVDCWGSDMTTLGATQFGRAAGATVMFDGDLGGVGRIQIARTTGPPLDHDIIGGWANVAGADFATYGGTAGVLPLTTYYTGGIKTATYTQNVLMTANEALISARNINSLKILGTPTLNLGTYTLNIESGGLLVAPGSGTAPAALITGGKLLAGASAANSELIVHVFNPIEIASVISNNPTAVGLTASGRTLPWYANTNILTLSGANAYTGPTTVNSTTLAIDTNGRLGSTTSKLTLFGGVLRATGTFTTTREVAIIDAAAIEVALGETLTLNGKLSGTVRDFYVRSVDLGGAGTTGTLVLNGSNTFLGDVTVGSGTGGDGSIPTLQVTQDGNLGALGAQHIYLNGGVFRAAGTFWPNQARVFVADPGGAGFEVAADQVFSLYTAGQLQGTGLILKLGPGTMVLGAANVNLAAPDVLIGEGTLELRDAQALGGAPVSLSGGTLGLRADAATAFPCDVTAIGQGTIHVGSESSHTPHPSIASLHLNSGSALTVTGDAWYWLDAGPGPVTTSGSCSIETLVPLLARGLAMGANDSVVTKSGAERLTINGPQSYAVGSRLRATAGAVQMDTDAGDPGTGSFERRLTIEAAGAGAAFELNASQHLAGVALSGGGTATLAAGGTKVLVANQLTIAEDGSQVPQGVLELAEHKAIVDYAGASPVVDIVRWVGSGLRGGPTGYWDGPGIRSSAAAAQADQLTALGVLDNADPKVGGKTLFAGEAVDATSILFEYTWWGDANFDGVVDANDYDVIDKGFLFPPAAADMGWWTGDFSYDGVIDANDYDRIDRAFLFQTGPLGDGGPGAAPTPEPATLALLVLGAVGLAARRRRA